MNIAKKICAIVKSFPEQKKLEVLSFTEFLNSQQDEKDDLDKQTALAILQKYRGRIVVKPFIRDDCYDR